MNPSQHWVPAPAPLALVQLYTREKTAIAKESVHVGGQNWLGLGPASERSEGSCCWPVCEGRELETA